MGLRSGGGGDGLEGEGKVSGRQGYGAMDTRWDSSSPHRLSDANWHNSPFAGISGLDISTKKGLLADGFKVPGILQAGRDVTKLRVNTNDNIAHAARLNKEAPGFMPQMHEYAGKLEGHRKTEGAIAKDEARLADMEKQGQGGSEAAAALRTTIECQKQELEKRGSKTKRR